MPRQTPLFIITSALPRVGRETLVARALTEYFLALRKPSGAFDVNPGEFEADRLPAGLHAAASLGDIRGEMALLDQRHRRATKLTRSSISATLLQKFFGLLAPSSAS